MQRPYNHHLKIDFIVEVVVRRLTPKVLNAKISALRPRITEVHVPTSIRLIVSAGNLRICSSSEVRRHTHVSLFVKV